VLHLLLIIRPFTDAGQFGFFHVEQFQLPKALRYPTLRAAACSPTSNSTVPLAPSDEAHGTETNREEGQCGPDGTSDTSVFPLILVNAANGFLLISRKVGTPSAVSLSEEEVNVMK
jgi:hypothetical protein